MTKRTELRINTPIGVDHDGNLIMVDSFFAYGDGMKGATGSGFWWHSEDDIEEQNDIETVKDSYGYLWQESVADGTTEKGLDDFCQELIDSLSYNHDGRFLGHDTSYLGYITNEAVQHFDAKSNTDKIWYEGGTFSCCQGGRMFSHSDQNLDVYFKHGEKLHALVRDFESGNFPIDVIEAELKSCGIPYEKKER